MADHTAAAGDHALALSSSSAVAGQRGRERRGLQVTLPRIPLHHDLMRPNLNRGREREANQRAIGQNASIARRVTCFFGRGGNVILEVGAVRPSLPNVTSLGIAVDYRHSSPFACDFERGATPLQMTKRGRCLPVHQPVKTGRVSGAIQSETAICQPCVHIRT